MNKVTLQLTNRGIDIFSSHIDLEYAMKPVQLLQVVSANCEAEMFYIGKKENKFPILIVPFVKD